MANFNIYVFNQYTRPKLYTVLIKKQSESKFNFRPLGFYFLSLYPGSSLSVPKCKLLKQTQTNSSWRTENLAVCDNWERILRYRIWDSMNTSRFKTLNLCYHSVLEYWKNLSKSSMLILRVELVQNNFFLISLADRFGIIWYIFQPRAWKCKEVGYCVLLQGPKLLITYTLFELGAE